MIPAKKTNRQGLIVIGLALVILLGIVDYLTGIEISFSIFYLIPISLVSWYSGLRTGIIFSILCGILWYELEIIGGQVYSNTAIGYWNGTMRGMIFLMSAILLSKLKEALLIEREARETAISASRVKSEFLANMSHEIRTPMNSVISTAQLLSDTQLSEEQKEYVQILEREGGHLLKLINDILDLSKVESGQFEIEKVTFDLKKLIEEIVSLMGMKVYDKGLELFYQIMPGVPERVVGDPGCLRRILVNLIGNAIKFTEKGRVSLRVENDPDNLGPGHLLFSVSDTGIGIPEDKLELIFKRFTQADISITRNYGGTGLGLNISQGMVEKMGGRIFAKSVLDQGSTFYFTVPFGIPSETEQKGTVPEDSEQEEVLAVADLRPLKILLVEDYDANRQIIRAFLKKTSYQIDEAENGMIALEKFKNGNYDLVLMDMQMPVMDGYTATRAIRDWESERKLKAIPVVALTAHAYKEDTLKSLEAGCNVHLSKPIDGTKLLETIYHLTEPEKCSRNEGKGLEKQVRVYVPPDFQDLIPPFLEEMRLFFRSMQDALARNELESIRELGHKIKGAGGSYGFQALSEIGASLEEGAKRKDLSLIRQRLNELSKYLEQIKVIYE